MGILTAMSCLDLIWTFDLLTTRQAHRASPNKSNTYIDRAGQRYGLSSRKVAPSWRRYIYTANLSLISLKNSVFMGFVRPSPPNAPVGSPQFSSMLNTSKFSASHLGGHRVRKILHDDAPLSVGLHNYGHEGGSELRQNMVRRRLLQVRSLRDVVVVVVDGGISHKWTVVPCNIPLSFGIGLWNKANR